MSRSESSRRDVADWRLLLDPPAGPEWNMAVDEWLLRGGGPPIPTVRFYAWHPAAVTLGRFQPPPPPAAAAYCRRQGIGLVRRPTGGGGVLHDNEITYSIAAPIGRGPFPRSVNGIYRRIAAALRRGLATLGIETESAATAASFRPAVDSDRPCFARRGRWEICWRGRKLIGSAQVRQRERFLQHGSIPIRIDRERLCAALGVPADFPLAATGIAAAAPEPIPRRLLIDSLVAGFEEEFGVSLREDPLSPVEIGIVRARVRVRPRVDVGLATAAAP